MLRPRPTRRIAIAVLLLIGMAAGSSFIVALNSVQKPGSFAVGEITLGPDVLGMSSERATALGGKPRPMIHVWYPAAGGVQAFAVKRLWRKVQRSIGGEHAGWARAGAPMARGSQRFPVVIYFPGWPGTTIDNYGLVCELASHGFVVAGVTYPAKLMGMSETAYQQQVKELEHWIVYSSEEVYHQAIQYSTDRVRFRARDAMSLLDGLARIDAADGTEFSHRLDLDRVGIMGFSLGGAVAAETSTLDPRIRAAVNIDGRHWGNALAGGVTQPYLFIGEELLQPSAADLASTNPDRRYNAIADRFDYSQLATNLRRNGGMQVVVANAEHADFTDGSFRSHFGRIVQRGRINAFRTPDILNAYVLAFMQTNLMGMTSPLLEAGNQPFSEVRIEIWKK